MEIETPEPRSFAEENFAGADLGDQRLTNRLVKIVERMVQHPGGSLPDKMQSPKDLKGLYRFVDNPKATHAEVLEPHYQLTLRRMRQHEGVVLLLQDATELDYTGKKSLTELGQIGNGSRRGYICQNTLAVDAATGNVLGLARQILHCREDVPPNETRQEKRKRQSRESRLWQRSSEAIGSAPAGQRWVDICDRGADIFEYLAHKHRMGESYVVRSKHNRTITSPSPQEKEQGKLHDHVRSLPQMGQRPLKIPARDNQPGRTAVMAVAWSKVQLPPPKNPRGEYGDSPLTTWVVRTWEIDPPAGADPVEWILLTNVAVVDFRDGCERINWYCRRWIVEEYHKAMKTGCGIENPQFTRQARLEGAIAILSVVALLLLNLRDASRRPDAEERLATDIFPVAYVKVLSGWRYQIPRSDLTIHEFFYALARLGGHQNRERDRPPGWLVLWRGWTKLQTMLEGAAAVGGL